MTKKLFFLLLILSTTYTGLFAQEIQEDTQEANDSTAVEYSVEQQIDWDNLFHNFGKIKAHERVEHTFTFTNVSKAPVTILDVKVTCGCTSPKWTEKPIMPGEKGEIAITFVSWEAGHVSKSIQVFTNADIANYPTKLFIGATVEEVEEEEIQNEEVKEEEIQKEEVQEEEVKEEEEQDQIKENPPKN